MNIKSTIKSPKTAAALRQLSPLVLRTCLAIGSLSSAWGLSAATAAAENRSLKLYFSHTGERAVITFKRDGAYDQNGLNQLNHFLRDWRRNETIRMDPLLFDIVWEMYKQSGATDYVNVVSGYRSPNTNAMLRSRSSGVAKESQHTQGKAVDFFIPGVKLSTLRGLGMQMQGGGVGYYPASGSPFVHIDVGRVRAWPRMSRQELARLFPNGRTLHIPSDGRPLPGYEFAVAEYKRRGSVSMLQVASNSQNVAPERSLFGNLFKSRRAEQGGDLSGKMGAAAQSEAVTTIAAAGSPTTLTAPIPTARPDESVLLTSLLPTETESAHQAFAALVPDVVSDRDDVAISAEQVPLPSTASRIAISEPVDELVTAAIPQLPQAIAALSAVPIPSDSGATALLGASDHLPAARFTGSYNAQVFWTASFQPVQKSKSHGFSGEPCPPVKVARVTDSAAEPC